MLGNTGEVIEFTPSVRKNFLFDLPANLKQNEFHAVLIIIFNNCIQIVV